jgi:aspartokinase/homoserine dehydrogenase 1
VSSQVYKNQWMIHKFGGSSLADADCFLRVAGLMLELDAARIGVVVSAMGGMTDALLDLVTLAERDDPAYNGGLDALGERYCATARSLLKGAALVAILDTWARDADDIRNVLKAIALVRSAPQRSRDVVSGYGELWSAQLLAALLKQQAPERGGAWLDARSVLIVRQTELGPAVQWDASRNNFAAALPEDFGGIVVITGFIASDEQGLQTTLGRNGSDYSAAIFAALSRAAELTIWTDVDGIMSADPNRVPEARVIDCMTYNEAMELAYFGAKVIHPQTLGPIIENEIPLLVRNSHNPSHPGSRIARDSLSSDNIKGITAIAGMALVNIEGAGMIGPVLRSSSAVAAIVR